MVKVGIDKDRILQVAIQLADTSGLHSITLKELAEKLNVRTPSLYNHFDGLRGLHTLLSLYGLKELKSTLTEATIGKSGDNAIKAMSRAYLDFAKKHPGVYESTQIINSWQDDEVTKASDDIVLLVGKIISTYGLSEQDAIHSIRMLRSLLHGFASLSGNNGFGNPISVDVSFEFAINTLVVGMHNFSKGEKGE